jgi:hypothetical protein
MPEGKLAPMLTTLLTEAETLNTASNSINTIINAVEERLVQANLGLEVWLIHTPLSDDTRPDENDEYGRKIQLARELGFAQVGSRWHIAIREQRYILDEDGNEESSSCLRAPAPLAQASRVDRLAALPLLPNLIGSLTSAAKEATQTIEKAKGLILC